MLLRLRFLSATCTMRRPIVARVSSHNILALAAMLSLLMYTAEEYIERVRAPFISHGSRTRDFGQTSRPGMSARVARSATHYFFRTTPALLHAFSMSQREATAILLLAKVVEVSYAHAERCRSSR